MDVAGPRGVRESGGLEGMGTAAGGMLLPEDGGATIPPNLGTNCCNVMDVAGPVITGLGAAGEWGT